MRACVSESVIEASLADGRVKRLDKRGRWWLLLLLLFKWPPTLSLMEAFWHGAAGWAPSGMEGCLGGAGLAGWGLQGLGVGVMT